MHKPAHSLSSPEAPSSGHPDFELFFSCLHSVGHRAKPFGRKSAFTTWGPLQLAGDKRTEHEGCCCHQRTASNLRCTNSPPHEHHSRLVHGSSREGGYPKAHSSTQAIGAASQQLVLRNTATPQGFFSPRAAARRSAYWCL